MRLTLNSLILMAAFAAVALVGCSAAEESVPAASGADETNVRPDINDAYKDPEINVDMWAERFTGESREVFVQRDAVLAALNLKPGERVADIGAGTGLFVKLFAETVGADGKVYAVDIAQPFLDFISKNAAEDGLTNVETVLGEDKTSNLPDESVNIVFHSDTYHHFEYPKTMVRDLARVLVAGGEMYVLDFDRVEGVSPEFILNHVRAGKQLVTEEIEASGFELVEEIDVPGLKDNYLLRFRKE